MISEKTYNEVKSKNLEYIERIKKEIASIKAGKVQIGEMPLDTIKKLVDHLSKLEELLAIQNERIGKLEKIAFGLESNETLEMKDLKERMEDIRKTIEEARRSLSFILE
jgi:hypothetical protein